MTDETFTGVVSKFLKALKRRCSSLTYLTINEWRRHRRHVHALLRVEGTLTRRTVSAAKGNADLRVRFSPVRDVMGICNYFFKHTRNPARKAELPPATWRGRLYSPSKGFLAKPFDELWRDIQAERPLTRTAGDGE